MTLSEVRSIVAELALPADHFALHGSGPLLAHGLIEEVNDLDLVSRGAAWSRACELAEPGQGDFDDVVRPMPGVEIFNGWLGEDADALIDAAVIRNGLPCVELEAVLRFKRRLGRPKDWAHIELIENYLRERQ